MVFNDLFCLSHPQVPLSVGASRPQNFDEHLKTLELLENSDEILPPIWHEQAISGWERLGENLASWFAQVRRNARWCEYSSHFGAEKSRDRLRYD